MAPRISPSQYFDPEGGRWTATPSVAAFGPRTIVQGLAARAGSRRRDWGNAIGVYFDPLRDFELYCEFSDAEWDELRDSIALTWSELYPDYPIYDSGQFPRVDVGKFSDLVNEALTLMQSRSDLVRAGVAATGLDQNGHGEWVGMVVNNLEGMLQAPQTVRLLFIERSRAAAEITDGLYGVYTGADLGEVVSDAVAAAASSVAYTRCDAYRRAHRPTETICSVLVFYDEGGTDTCSALLTAYGKASNCMMRDYYGHSNGGVECDAQCQERVGAVLGMALVLMHEFVHVAATEIAEKIVETELRLSGLVRPSPTGTSSELLSEANADFEETVWDLTEVWSDTVGEIVAFKLANYWAYNVIAHRALFSDSEPGYHGFWLACTHPLLQYLGCQAVLDPRSVEPFYPVLQVYLDDFLEQPAPVWVTFWLSKTHYELTARDVVKEFGSDAVSTVKAFGVLGRVNLWGEYSLSWCGNAFERGAEIHTLTPASRDAHCQEDWEDCR